MPTILPSYLYSAQISTAGAVNLYRRNGYAWTQLASFATTIQANVSYTLKLVVSGSTSVHLEAWLNGTKLISFDDASSSRITSGPPGIVNYDGQREIRLVLCFHAVTEQMCLLKRYFKIATPEDIVRRRDFLHSRGHEILEVSRYNYYADSTGSAEGRCIGARLAGRRVAFSVARGESIPRWISRVDRRTDQDEPLDPDVLKEIAIRQSGTCLEHCASAPKSARYSTLIWYVSLLRPVFTVTTLRGNLFKSLEDKSLD